VPTGYGYGPYGHTPYGHPTPSPSTIKIRDAAYNNMGSPETGQMLGYIEPPAPEEILSLDIYRFILNSIRLMDQTPEGALFLKRFLQGPQIMWKQIQERVFAVKNLWNIAEVDNDQLPYLQNIVGWTGKLQNITSQLDDDTLRRLIATSSALWKQRGPEDTLLDVLNLTTGARARMWNWFDYRWVLDETELGAEHQGRDAWMVDLPTEGDDEYRSNLRIVDDGALNHKLVKNLTRLMRATEERIEISYIDFLDQFTKDGEDGQWTRIFGQFTVEGGMAKLTDDTQKEWAASNAEIDTGWKDYVCYWRIRGTSSPGLAPSHNFGVIFYGDITAGDAYILAVNPSENQITLGVASGGFFTTVIQTVSQVLYDDVWYGVRIQITTEGATNRIKVYLDNDEVINATDATYMDGGTIGVYHQDQATVELDEIEMFQLPLETDLIDINS